MVKYYGDIEEKGVDKVFVTILMVVDVIVALALIAVVLLQSGKSAGLSGAFGGGGESMFGGRPTDMDEMLSRCTIVLGILFGVVTLLIAKFQ